MPEDTRMDWLERALADLPRAGFRERLKQELERRAATMTTSTTETIEPRAIREGFPTVTPYVVVHDVPALIDFAVRAFGARELGRTSGGGGGMHAEVEIGDSKLMIGGGSPEQPWSGDARPTAFHVYVPKVDDAFERALQAGAT